MIRTPEQSLDQLPRYSDGRAYRFLGKLPRHATGEAGSWCGAVALGAVGDCTRGAGHGGPHQNTATGDAFEILEVPGEAFEVDLDALSATGATDEENATRYGLTLEEWRTLYGGLVTNRALGTTGALSELRGHDGAVICRFSSSRIHGTARYIVRVFKDES